MPDYITPKENNERFQSSLNFYLVFCLFVFLFFFYNFFLFFATSVLFFIFVFVWVCGSPAKF